VVVAVRIFIPFYKRFCGGASTTHECGFFEGFEARNTYIAKPFFDTILHNVLECFLGFMNQR